MGVMRVIGVFFALLSAIGVARAGDFPDAPPPAPPAPPVVAAPPVYDWTGFYIGVNAGWEFEHVRYRETLSGLQGYSFVGIGGAAIAAPDSLSSSSTSNGNAAVAGGQAGFNWQAEWAVFGIEGDFDWTGQQATQTVGSVTNTSKSPWFATIRGRFGTAFDRLLVYGTAGAAFLDVSQNIAEAGSGTLFNESKVDFGWTAGAGVESAFTQNWTARVEYLFVDADLSLSGPYADVLTLSHAGTITRNIVRGGMSYKFQ